MTADSSAIAWDFTTPFILYMTPKTSDIDGLNHVNNAVYVQWCEQVAWAHSEQLGLCLDDYRRLDRAMAIRRGAYDYILPALIDDALLLATWLTAGDGKLAMTRNFQLVRARDKATLMRGSWDLVCIELSSGRVRRMPNEFCDVYNAAIVASTGG